MFEQNDPDSAGELADLIDRLMSEGTGHLNISTRAEGDGLSVETTVTTDCGTTGACCQPTEEISDED